MKNYKVPFVALLIVGLLVVTGCSAVFGPPKAAADKGEGLIVSINGDDGRTILPTARLEKYEITVTGAGGQVGDKIILSGGQGSKIVSLPPGEYTVAVDGYVGDVKVADGTGTGTVVADAFTAVPITLTATKDSGDGTFAWNFEGLELDDVAIEIYAIDDDAFAADLLDDDADITGEKTLAAGVYNVKFTATIDGEDYTWWEILYIYYGLTSNYRGTSVNAQEVLPTIPYVVPASGYGYFYLDLNNWKTAGTDAINATVPKGATATDGLTVTYTLGNQRVNIGLTADQVALLRASPGPIDVTIVGSAEPNTSTFRYHLGRIDTSSSWNATDTAHAGNPQTLIGPGDPAGTGITKELVFVGNKSNAATLAYFILQMNARVADTTVTINSIKISFPLDTFADGGFELDLTDNTYDGSPGNARPLAQDITVGGDGVLSADFKVNPQWLNIGISSAQKALLLEAATTGDAETLFVTVWGTAVNPALNARAYVGDPSLSSWNATNPAKNNTDIAISKLLSTTGETSVLTPTNVVALNYFILQSRSVLGVVEISRIRIDYVLKEKWIAPPAATEDAEIITAANPVTVTGSWGQWGNIQIDLSSLIPAGFENGAYGSFTLTFSPTGVAATDIQWWFVSSASDYYGSRLGTDVNASGRSAGGTYSEVTLELSERKGASIKGIYAQPKVTGPTTEFTITELTFHPAE